MKTMVLGIATILGAVAYGVVAVIGGHYDAGMFTAVFTGITSGWGIIHAGDSTDSIHKNDLPRLITYEREVCGEDIEP